MKTSEQVFTPEQWARHEQFVAMFRAAKQRKREWQARKEIELSAQEEYARMRRAEVDELFKD